MIRASGTPHTAPVLAALGGDDNRRVLRAARRVGMQHEARVVCVHVAEFHGDAFSRDDCEILRGDPAQCIARRARELGARLVVMGIGRHRPLDRIFGADTALRTIQQAPCAVLAVARGGATPATDVVVGTDFSDASLYAARDALAVAAPGATLHFVHVWNPTRDADDDLAREEQEHRAALPGCFRAFVERLDPVPASRTFTVRDDGRVTECLIDEARQRGAGIIAVGRHGRGALASLVVGSVATRVLRASTCSVLVSPGLPV